MVQIVLIRPGTSEFDQQGRIQGNLDIPLCQQGLLEVQRCLGELQSLGLSIVYSSPCEAARQTAGTIAAGLGIKAKPLDSLENLDHGLWQGLLVEEVKRKQPKVFRQWQEHPEMVCPPEGEMLNDCKQRVAAALAKLQKKHREGTIGIVAPEPLASVIHCAVSNGSSTVQWKSNACGCAWEVLGQNVRSESARGHEKPATPTSEPANEPAAPLPPLAGNGFVPQFLPKNGATPSSISLPVSLESHS